jgi:hypothetical protein
MPSGGGIHSINRYHNRRDWFCHAEERQRRRKSRTWALRATCEYSAARETIGVVERKSGVAVVRDLTSGAFEMRKLSVVAIVIAFVGFTGVGRAVANGNMGDPSAHQRQIQENCDAQRRGEYPSYPNACPSWAIDKPVQR